MFEVRKTGADDSSTGFNSAPGQGIKGSPRGIMRRGALLHGLHADDTGYANEKTKTEHNHDANLADSIQLQSR